MVVDFDVEVVFGRKFRLIRNGLAMFLLQHGNSMNLWILSRLAAAVEMCNSGFENYDFKTATTACYNLWLYELCDVYLVSSCVHEYSELLTVFILCVSRMITVKISIYWNPVFITEIYEQYCEQSSGEATLYLFLDLPNSQSVTPL